LDRPGNAEIQLDLFYSSLGAQQSSALANFDTFFIFTVVAVALIVLVFFMKRSFAEKSAHVAAE